MFAGRTGVINKRDYRLEVYLRRSRSIDYNFASIGKSTREPKFKRWYIAGNIVPKASATMLGNPTTGCATALRGSPQLMCDGHAV